MLFRSLTIALGLGGALLVVVQLERNSNSEDPLRRQLNLCLKPLKQLQLEPRAGETLWQFCQRAVTAQPWLRPLLEQLCNAYNGHRYSAEVTSARQVARQVQQLRGELRRAVHRRRA